MIERDHSESYLKDEKALRKFTRLMVKKQNFVGAYIEQRYVSSLKCYKKIIRISKNEKNFVENLLIIKRRIENFYQGSRWIGITTSDASDPVDFDIWVDVDEEIFGIYRFYVQDVIFTETEVCLKVGVIKPCEDVSDVKRSSKNVLSSSFLDSFEGSISEVYSSFFTLENFKNATLFSFLLILTFVTGSIHVIKYLLEYFLKLIQVLTPTIEAFFNLVARMFGYLCFLIAFLFRGDEKSRSKMCDFRHNQSIYYQPIYPNYIKNKALPYREKSSVVITEL